LRKRGLIFEFSKVQSPGRNINNRSRRSRWTIDLVWKVKHPSEGRVVGQKDSYPKIANSGRVRYGRKLSLRFQTPRVQNYEENLDR
jgi:hypothetical protein